MARYTNGQWRLTDYAALNTLLKKLSQKGDLFWPVLKAAIQAAVVMAESGQGATFAFVKDARQILWRDRMLDDFGLQIENASLLQLNPHLLATLAKPNGAVIMNSRGHILAAHAFFETDEPVRRTIGTSARHQAAQQFSRQAEALCIVASRYGTITVYYKGQALAQI